MPAKKKHSRVYGRKAKNCGLVRLSNTSDKCADPWKSFLFRTRKGPKRSMKAKSADYRRRCSGTIKRRNAYAKAHPSWKPKCATLYSTKKGKAGKTGSGRNTLVEFNKLVTRLKKQNPSWTHGKAQKQASIEWKK
jgi:hypothetical protein